MPKIIAPSYGFDPATGTVALYGLPPLSLEAIAIVTNVTDGTILYNFADDARANPASIAGNVLTTGFDCSAMSSMDDLQIIVTVPDKYAEPAELALRGALESGLPGLGQGPVIETTDTNLDRWLELLTTASAYKLAVNPQYQDKRASRQLMGLNDEFSVATDGYASCSIQIAGTWAGSIAFEVTADGGNWVTAYPTAGVATNSTTINNGTYRLSVAALARVRVRWATYTSGVPFVTFALSALPLTLPAVGGSQGQTLQQRASTFELNTWDNNLATVLGALNLIRSGWLADVIIAPTAPTMPTTYASNAFAKVPQIQPRLRVEAAGSEKLPLAQVPNSLEMRVVSDEIRRLLEELVLRTALVNQADINQGFVAAPQGWDELS
jgi:hypothetical protein